MLKEFRIDPNYLYYYHLKSAFFWGTLSIALLALGMGPDGASWIVFAPFMILATSTNLKLILALSLTAILVAIGRHDFSWVWLGTLPATVLLTFLASSLIHCASHDSLGAKWLNRLVGELVGLVQLSGFPDWKIIHVLHHQHADDQDLDPHPPLKKAFWPFAFSMRDSIARVYVNFYCKIFGSSETSARNLRRFSIAARLDSAAKVLLWFTLLGPQGFTWLFLVSLSFKMVHWAWFNYVTHRPKEGDGTEIRNLSSISYRIINLFSLGLYFHKNHHDFPHLRNPSLLSPTREEKVAS